MRALSENEKKTGSAAFSARLNPRENVLYAWIEPKSWRLFRLGSLKLRLQVLAGLPLLALPVLGALLFFLGNEYFDRLLIHKVDGDLAMARSHLQHIQKEVLEATRSLAESHEFADWSLARPAIRR